jgi:hypothetical protein
VGASRFECPILTLPSLGGLFETGHTAPVSKGPAPNGRPFRFAYGPAARPSNHHAGAGAEDLKLLCRFDVAIPAGLEPATRGVEIRYSIQLSYGTVW